MVHLSKLAVGIGGVGHLAQVQAERLAQTGRLHHLTRLAPRRVEALVSGGSIYWVIAGAMQARQLVTAVEPASRDDGTLCAALILDPALVRVEVRTVRAFQGWRYLEASDAPADRAGDAGDGADVPEAMRRTLVSLGLL
jgi:hypothetical protein